MAQWTTADIKVLEGTYPSAPKCVLRRALPDSSDQAVYRNRCVYCGAPADTIDHVTPCARGGLHEIGNLLPVCGPCNFAKHDKTREEFINPRKD